MTPLQIGIASVVLFGLSAIFVAAEYALFGVRRSKVASQAEKGDARAKLLLAALDDRNPYVAGIQLGITVLGIAIGSIVEPYLSDALDNVLQFLPPWLVSTISVILIAYPLVVLAELVPKYLTLKFAEPIAYALIRPLRFYLLVTRPFIWLFQSSAGVVLRPFGINLGKAETEAIGRDELQMLLQAGESEGQFDEAHADVIMKALRLDRLDAKDVMVHRLDMEAVPSGMPIEDLMARLRAVSHSRLPVYGDDMDDIKGIVYIADILKGWNDPKFRLEEVIRPAEFVPESVTLDRCLEIMRARRTQILLVRDEYGGTSGMLTLEDVVEEIFGDLQDQPEAERPIIQRVGPSRLRLSPKVRWDQLLAFLDQPLAEDTSTDTLSQMVLDSLERIPKQGDAIDTPLGRLVVEQTTRKRIIQLGLILEKS